MSCTAGIQSLGMLGKPECCGALESCASPPLQLTVPKLTNHCLPSRGCSTFLARLTAAEPMLVLALGNTVSFRQAQRA